MVVTLASWWGFLAVCTVIVYKIRKSNIGEYNNCIDVEFEVKAGYVGGSYCRNPYWDIVNKDVKVCG